MDRSNLKLNPTTKNRLDELKRDGETWDGFFNRAATELEKERAIKAQERQGDSLEAIAGMMMMRFEYDEDMPSYSTEAMLKEARHFASGGELQL